ncbi:MAG: VWA domain-containing protein [candidate division Zixibacteria bacterium]
MRFAEPINFLILFAVLIIGSYVFYAIARKKVLLRRFSDIPLVMKNAPYISFARQRTKAMFLLVGLVFVVIALARLQFGTHLELARRQGIDLIVAMDVSTSMLTADQKPNRLARARQEVRSIIDRLQGDRIGLIAFAGEAFVQCPLTLDYSAAQMLLGAMDNNSVSIQGTSLAEAIDMAVKSFNQQERKHKVLLLVTDGENHDERAGEVAEEARSQGVKIFTVGIGNPAGEPIPVIDRSGKQVGFKKDPEGEVIVSKLNEQVLQEIALATGGKYYHATPGEMELDRIFDEIASLEKKELEGTLITKYDDRFQWPLLFALIFVIGEFFLPERKKPDASAQQL